MNQKGFTIVELLIVIVIIGIVLALGMAVWNKGVQDAEAHCKEKYGQEYTLGMDRSNSSIQYCVSPYGVMKSL